jgi:hypothetical protein
VCDAIWCSTGGQGCGNPYPYGSTVLSCVSGIVSWMEGEGDEEVSQREIECIILSHCMLAIVDELPSRLCRVICRWWPYARLEGSH